MASESHIEWEPGRVVSTMTEGPPRAPLGVVLAHGAGAGQSHPFIAGLRSRLAAAGFPATSFDYPYVAEGRRAPDRLPTLVSCHQAVAARVREEFGSVALVGKSMGGRVGSHVSGFDSSARVFLGYPLVAPGKAVPRDTSHLDRLAGPMLFLQGERDRLAPLDLIRGVADRVGATLVVVDGADHSFRLPKRLGVDSGTVLDDLAQSISDWLASTAAGRDPTGS